MENIVLNDLIHEIAKLNIGNKRDLDKKIKKIKKYIDENISDSNLYINRINVIIFEPPPWENITNENVEKYWLEGINNIIDILEELNSDYYRKIEKNKNNKIFIVHGHDEEIKQSVARTIERLELEAIILHQEPDLGRTIIQKFEDESNVAFAIICLSPDDYGYIKGENPNNAKTRARQNVIFEFGYFCGKIKRKNVFVLFKKEKDFELPSDLLGVIYHVYDKEGKWRNKLCQELMKCGFNVDFNKIIDL